MLNCTFSAQEKTKGEFFLGSAEGKMKIMRQVDGDLLERGTTSREDNNHESSHEMNGENNDKEAKRRVYLDENAGTAIEWSPSEKNPGVVDLDNIPKILNSVINKTLILDAPQSGSIQKDEILSSEGSSKGHVKIDLVEENEEEILELEFERAVGKMHSHNIYCPHCSSQVTRVILRRKPQIKNPDPKEMGLLGCLSCFSIFSPSGNTINPFRCFGSKEEPKNKDVASGAPTNDKGETIMKKGNTINPFRCFGSKEEPENPEDASGAPTNDKGETIMKKGDVFDLLWNFGKPEDNENAQNYDQLTGGENENPPNHHQPLREENEYPSSQLDDDHSEQVEEDDNKSLTRSKARARSPYVTPPANDANKNGGSTTYTTLGSNILGNQPKVPPPGGLNSAGDHRIDLVEEPGTDPQTEVPPNERPSPPGYFEHGSKSLEILKSIVYGGLVESIGSLSIVSSAAASETATMNIVALGSANVISGIFVIAHNLRDMKNECPEPDSNEQTDRYQELIGERENFLFHFTFAIISFLLFGLIPPAVYGLAFEKTGNKDYTIIAVAASSLICIILLSIGKAYCKGEHRFIEYFKTVSYYVSNAVAVSGVAYAMGDLIKILAEKLGWFEPSTPTPAALFNSGINSATPFFAYS